VIARGAGWARLLAVCVGALALGGCARPATVVLLARHAEKQDGTDPSLTEEGRRRAEALGAIADCRGVSRIYVTQYRRTRETAEPAARRLGLTPIVVEAGPDGSAHAAEVAARVLGTGGVVLVVGHSNTIPAIIERLGIPNPPAIADDQYGDLFVVTLRPGRPAVMQRLRYGPLVDEGFPGLVPGG